MPSPNNHSLRVIFVDDSTDSGKATSVTFNKAGYGVKGIVATSFELLEKSLTNSAWDMIVANYDSRQLPLAHVNQILLQNKNHPPLLAVSKEIDTTTRISAMKSGAIDVVPPDVPELLALVLKREFSTNKTASIVTQSQTSTKHSLSDEECAWKTRIETALEQNRLMTVFQPIVNLCSDPKEIYEVLLRMLDDDDQEILPGAFIGVAEKTGLMAQIDRWVINHTIATLSDRLNSGEETCFFVKLSEATLADQTFIPWLSDRLHQTGIPGHQLAFEVSESVANNNETDIKNLFGQLRKINCLTVLDHVGAENPDNETWMNFDLSYIKIAGRLMQDLASNENSRKAVTLIASKAKTRQINTIAQFVQDSSSLSFLYQRGINYIQGYYLQRPDIDLSYSFPEEEVS